MEALGKLLTEFKRLEITTECDMLLFDPAEDELNANRNQVKNKDTQYSCGNCFQALAYTTAELSQSMINNLL